MGSSSSKPNNKNSRAASDVSNQQQKDAKTESDVLLPPIFAIPVGGGKNNGSNNPLQSYSTLLSSLPQWQLPPSVQDRLVRHQTNISSPFSLIDYLHQTDPSVRLIHDFMQPGFWITSNAAAGTHVRASCLLLSSSPWYNNLGQQQQQQQPPQQQQQASSSMSSSPPLQTHICIERSRRLGTTTTTTAAAANNNNSNSNNSLKLTAGTDPLDLPALHASMNLFNPALVVQARSNVQGQGWIGIQWANTLVFSSSTTRRGSASSSSKEDYWKEEYYYRNNPFAEKEEEHETNKQQEINLHVGAWVTLDGNKKKTKSRTTSSSLADSKLLLQTKLLPSSIQSVNLSAATNLLGATAAVEASLPMMNKDNRIDYGSFSTRSYLSINLTDEDNDNNNNNNENVDYPNPPLRLSLERTNDGINNNTTSSISLSQSIYLDRYQLNPLEDRAPRVRNALAWALSLERNNNNNNTTQTTQNPMQVSLAGAWQINRAVAIKTKLEPDAITTALILKRWKQPRILCSIQYCHDWKQQQQQQFGGANGIHSPRQSWGIGIEVETGRWNRDLLSGSSASGGGGSSGGNPSAMASLYPVGDNASSLRGVSKSNDDDDIPPTIPSSWTESQR